MNILLHGDIDTKKIDRKYFQLTGATGDPIHSGSWFGLPDFGLTEAIGNYFGQGRTAQGGSNLNGDQSQTTLINNGNNTFSPMPTVQNYQTKTTTTGGNPLTSGGTGGGGTDLNALWHQMYPNGGDRPTGWNGPAAQPQGVSDEDINNAFNPVFGALNNAYNNQKGLWNDWNTATTTQYDALKPDVENAFKQGSNLNMQQTQENEQNTQNALSAARNLYNELSQGTQQRFGGASSTADFAKAFYGRQLQQNEGSIYGTQGVNQRSLQTQMANLQSQRDTNLQRIDEQKTAALSQAKLEFNNRLAQIDQLRYQTEQAKASAKLQALSELKATANAINQQATQFAQQQQMAANQIAASLLGNIATAQANSGVPVNMQQVAQLARSQFNNPNQTTYNPYLTASGYTGNKDQYGNTI